MPFVQPRYAHDKPKARYRTAEAPSLLNPPPPPGWYRTPFRTRYQTGTKHRLFASARLVGFLCSAHQAPRHEGPAAAYGGLLVPSTPRAETPSGGRRERSVTTSQVRVCGFPPGPATKYSVRSTLDKRSPMPRLGTGDGGCSSSTRARQGCCQTWGRGSWDRLGAGHSSLPFFLDDPMRPLPRCSTARPSFFNLAPPGPPAIIVRTNCLEPDLQPGLIHHWHESLADQS